MPFLVTQRSWHERQKPASAKNPAQSDLTLLKHWLTGKQQRLSMQEASVAGAAETGSGEAAR